MNSLHRFVPLWLVLSGFSLPSFALAEPSFLESEVSIIRESSSIINGRKVYYRLIEPPKMIAKAEVEPSPVELIDPTDLESQLAIETESIALSVTIFDEEVSLLRWKYNGEDFEAFSNINFNYLRGVRQFELADQPYKAFVNMMGFGNDELDRSMQQSAGETSFYWSALSQCWVPALSNFSSEGPTYLVFSDEAIEEDAAYEQVEVIHQYYFQNEANLIAEYHQREEENALRREEFLAEKARKEAEPRVLYFWKKQ